LSGEQEPSSTSRDEATISLVLDLRNKAPEAAEQLQRLYRDALVRFCWGYLERMDEAEDAVQDIACKVLASAEVPPAERFRPWLYRVARFHCLNLLRDRAHRKDGRQLPAGSQFAERLTGNLTRLVRDEQRARLGEMVRALPEAQQEVLRLRYVEDLSRAEIAEVLDLPESVVKSRLFEGMKRLRDFADEIEKS
jgi:RNA polymerase sigma-70 factor (ECF subfamily)